MILETERLLLRSWQITDAEAVLALWGNPEVMRFVGAPLVPDLDYARRLIHWALEYEKTHGYCRWAVAEKANGKVTGSCGFLYDNDHAAVDVGYYFIPDKWGYGYATEILEACLRYSGLGRDNCNRGHK